MEMFRLENQRSVSLSTWILSRGQLAQEECMFHNQKQNYGTEHLGDKHISQNELGY